MNIAALIKKIMRERFLRIKLVVVTEKRERFNIAQKKK
jgi:hypothetical protein